MKIMTKKLFFRLVRIYKQTDFVRIVLWINVLFSAIVQFCCLPPHGGSGLKFDDNGLPVMLKASPSPRREWIEITGQYILYLRDIVSLPTEGVD